MTELDQLRRLVEASGACHAETDQQRRSDRKAILAVEVANTDFPAILAAWERDREELGRVVEMIGEACDAAARVEATQARHYLADLYESVKATLPKGTQ